MSKTTLTRQELSSIKQTLFNMIKDSGRVEESAYESIGESLGELNFNEFTYDEYAEVLLSTIEAMLNLDDLAFDIPQLYTIQHKLS
jgi:hypothetical protein